MELCNGCKNLDKQYEFTNGGFGCFYNYYCITPQKGFNTIEKWSEDKDVLRPKWCPGIVLAQQEKIKDDKRTRRRICLRS